MDARLARLILNALPNIGPVTVRRLMDEFGPDPAALLRAPRDRLLAVKGVGPAIADTLLHWRRHFDAEREQSQIAERGLRFLIPEDTDYPALLRETYDPPIGLYSLGKYTVPTRGVAVIGTRNPTLYGKSLARDVAKQLAAAGWCIVSGLARGIDTEAHRGALDAGGKTVAVLGCGADIVYPPENLDLYREIAAHGVILSEFPLGRAADKRTFPMRNRVVAGLCKAVVVIESDDQGGSMITARFAAEQGRTVCAFPGRVDQPTSRGCHTLIRDGATLVTSAAEILEELGEAPRQAELDFDTPAPPPSTALPDRERRLLAHFAGGACHTPDSLAGLTELPIGDLTSSLLLLELAGKIARTPDGRYEVR
jgi:DNA processing protein